MSDRLTQFIDHARQKGLDYETIFLLLRSVGWKDREVAVAVAARELEVDIPNREGVGSARDAFLHLLAFSALYASYIAVIFLLFSYIEFAFPDPAIRTTTYMIDSALSSIRFALATLIISYPVFISVWRFLLREIEATPEKAKGSERRWLASLTLFIGAIVLMGDAITLVDYLVEGDVTLRFALKVATLFVVTGGVFGYLAFTLRSEAEVEK